MVNLSISKRVQIPVYSTAGFSNSLGDIVPLVIPLWLTTIDVEPILIGLTVSARYIGPLLFSIQGGALMDRFGVRKVLIFFGCLGAITPLLYSFSGWLPFVICLQLVGGLADSISWSGSQTLTNQVFKGCAVLAGRMIAATRIGTLIGPFIAGICLDSFGPIGGFLAMSLWGFGTLISIIIVPAFSIPRPVLLPTVEPHNIIPKFADYRTTFRLLSMPIIATMMAVTTLRQVGSSIQGSFYTIHLSDVGVSEIIIGLLFAMNGLAGIFSVWTGWLTRYFNSEKLLFWSVGISIFSITIVPVSENLIFQCAMAALRGFSLAISVALLLAILAKEVKSEYQGRLIGLRMTCHQLLNVIVPIALGIVVQITSMVIGFYLIGGLAILGLFIVSFRYRLTK